MSASPSVYDSPLPPSSPQISASASHSSRNLDPSECLQIGSDRDNSSTRQLPTADDDSFYPEHGAEDYRDGLHSNFEPSTPDDEGHQRMDSIFSELRGSSLPAPFRRFPGVDRSTNRLDEELFELQLISASASANAESPVIPSAPSYQGAFHSTLSYRMSSKSKPRVRARFELAITTSNFAGLFDSRSRFSKK